MPWRLVFSRIRPLVVFFRVSPFLIPLFQFVNSSIIFIGPMSIPLACYVTGLSVVVRHEGWAGVLDHILLDVNRNLFNFGHLFHWDDVPPNYVFPETVSSIQIVFARLLLFIGLGLLFFSLFYFYRHRRRMLDGGPYHLVRHPQYLAILMITAGITIYALRSGPVWMIEPLENAQYWISSRISWLAVHHMVILSIWLIEVFGYVGLTRIEERNMESRFPVYSRYKESVPFLSWVLILIAVVLFMGIFPSIIWSIYP